MSNVELEKQWEIISRGSEEIIGEEELKKKLLQGKKLRVKFGADPTAPELHLGHTVVMEKLRSFQELGHKVIFIIGDFTAMIGDPSGRTVERPILTKDEIEKSIAGYEKQIFKILKKENIELRRNSEWLKALGAEGIIELSKHYTVARMLERNDFEARYKKGNPITITEFIYPLLQGYDSVELESDIEIGGTDQKFNLLVGRELQKDKSQCPQAILTMPLLEGTDGVRKMSKSYGNHIGIDESPSEIFGKIMSVSDELMFRYYTLLTDVNVESIKEIHPMEAKKKLAWDIVARYHNEKAAEEAKNGFEQVYSKREAPSVVEKVTIKKGDNIKLIDVIKLVWNKQRSKDGEISNAEVKRKIAEGAVTFNGDKITDRNFVLKHGDNGVVSYGKKKRIDFEVKSE